MTLRQKIFSVIAGALLLAVFAFLLIVSHFRIPTGGDAEEARTLLDHLHTQYEFPAETYWSPRVSRTILSIHGVVDPTEQKRVAALVRIARRERGLKPVVLNFYEREVILDRGNGLEERGEERLLRTITVD